MTNNDKCILEVAELIDYSPSAIVIDLDAEEEMLDQHWDDEVSCE